MRLWAVGGAGARGIPGLQLLADPGELRVACRAAGTRVPLLERRALGVGKVFIFDIQGWITLFLGGLLALITLFSSYSHVHIPFLGAVVLNQQRLFR